MQWDAALLRVNALPVGLTLTANETAGRRDALAEAAAAHALLHGKLLQVRRGVDIGRCDPGVTPQLFDLLKTLHIGVPPEFAPANFLMASKPQGAIHKFMLWVNGQLRTGMCDPQLTQVRRRMCVGACVCVCVTSARSSPPY